VQRVAAHDVLEAVRMISTAIRPQRDVIGVTGKRCKAWEFDYYLATFYIQETDGGYTIVEETKPRGSWMGVRPERQRLVLAEFERARKQRRL
jgi:hypothetical protein